MKTKLPLTILALCMLAFVACGDDDNEVGPMKMQRLSGHVEKGPFVQGSEVTLHELTADLSQTGKSFRTQTEGALGAFNLNTAMELVSQYVELSVTGFYYNEVRGELSTAPITLHALSDVSGRSTMNVNLLTHLTQGRTKKLLSEGKSFNDAKAQAGRELLRVFAIDGELPTPENVSISDNSRESGILLAISTILLHDYTDAEFTELLSAFATEFAENGRIISTPILKAIQLGQAEAQPSKVIEKMQDFYNERGISLQIQDFSPYIDFNGNGVIDEQDKEADLDNHTTDTIVEENLITNENDVKTIINVILSQLSYFSADQLTLQMQRFGLLESRIYDINLNSPTSDYIASTWNDGYKAINYINTATMPLEQRQYNFDKKPYLGLLYALRAYTYYQLSILWGNIPYYTENPDIETFTNIPQTSSEDVLRGCFQDLDAAIPLLQEAEEQHSDWKNILGVSSDLVPNSHAARALYTEICLALGKPTPAPTNLSTGFVIKMLYYNDALDGHYFMVFREEIGREIPNIVAYDATTYGLLSTEVEKKNDTEAQKELASLWKNLANKGVVGAWAAVKRLGQAQALTGCKNHELLLPIPAQDLRTNPNWKQNPGYE